ncbi:hypothetical protein L5G32_13540 [Gordonia sp. HY002]|uniref:hypothetical protein n=1 Tax=Gordonia zhenghanii TaxID=2911516 RepID=UPI001EEF81B0|nr:hypothetical protein [Gordonia zhenghanii]MCF8571291.1 hypothetical protein [Gordonia zhenghanii]MCF8601815.1 hypothetical protein [Gordonia zhenghanii]
MTAEKDLAARLLDAQVEFTRRQLTDPDEFAALVHDEITHALDDASQITLSESVSRDLIKAVAHKYAIAFPVEGAIPELVGRVAARLYDITAAEDVGPADLIGRKQLDDLTDDIAQLGLSQRLVQRLLDSPATVDTFVEVVQRSVDSSRLPSGLGRFVDGAVESVVRHGAAFVLRANRSDSDELLADTMRDLSRAGTGKSVGDLSSLVEPGDLEDVVVLVFEFWRAFRDTEYFAGLLAAGVDEVFDTYGDTALDDLLTDLGIGYDDLVEEGLRFGPPVIADLDRRGLLEPSLRRRFAPFYASQEFRDAVGSVD